MFPRRTLLLMLLALAAFGRLWCVTHQKPDDAPAAPVHVELESADAGR